MEEFRRQFLDEAVAALESLKVSLQSAERFSGAEKRAAFRTLHTLKGTAQTFGFAAASRLAHELETLFADNENPKNLLLEGIKLLTESLTEKDFQMPSLFASEIASGTLPPAEKASGENVFPSEIPSQILSQLSSLERHALRSALGEKRKIYCLEIGFPPPTFADDLINFRAFLNAVGEIIATFPGAKIDADDDRLRFQFLLASAARIEHLTAENSATIAWHFAPENLPNDADAILAQIARHGAEIAAKLGKTVEIKTQTDATAPLASTTRKLVFDTLLHLVRNAVDHAIEGEGEIQIGLRREKNGLRLTVSDDGRGIDLEKVKAQAAAKKIISADQILDDEAAIDLIFSPQLSTKSELSEVSGRGVGLDAVRDAVTKIGGAISVKTQKEKGTTFEIFLPQEEN